MTLPQPVEHNDVYRAYQLWHIFCERNVTLERLVKQRVISFEGFLGEQIEWQSVQMWMQTEAVRKIQLLNSPHCHTLLQAWFVQRFSGFLKEMPE